MKVLITGAHFTPAVAVIEQLKKVSGLEVVYVGRKTTFEGDKAKSAESAILPSLGVKFIPIITGRLQRTFTLYTIPSLFKIPIGFLQSIFILLSQKPDVILSFGGYVSVPVVITGWLFSVPVIIHEQTLFAGLANRICSYFADKIAVSFKDGEFKGEKVVLTGNPIRRDIYELSKKAAQAVFREKKMPAVLIIGGNQGSHAINTAVEKILDKLTKIAKVYHQTGDSKYGDFERLNNFSGENYKVFKFIGNQWTKILEECDLVVSRAGINSLTELAFLGKPVLLIPIGNSEQKKNAQYFSGIGLAKILPESKLTGETLLEQVKLMLSDLKTSSQKAQKAKELIIPDGAKRLTLETLLLVNSPKN
ncbi:MAG: UDP-N-acetylglucosamine-N-acetylmuramyl- (pentapeptide) pyrophosphoryl-UDP N- acetylglucosamine transferase [Candidatus Daviesbacteria bacterium GW2011_GWB1_39_5]|uniref:UDP-N-acetylglucosamine--N-acetylmuramyl-(pentapeptide) pyrophosphoryl-undecaprenol N-acetylglucosamine transferase n=1 Tax=Candidatus Daviesbacteria bacterium GW2011_GWC2_40_12 TaxID=1618431 RepID=A0A0G0QZ82_9BACT|nr:MAG: UDP-N-acetylglucosamine-N-acetylmuramyl- (pentapeptide) pyrophosphoryl-UDP N- acetylglucosamine transferase [Candidatus Daviesbacteria bacterium GW2011_GWF2_38_7]KKR17359.1 MAG: UDP-N-acetylglucosamine-N-acetylmuramyl- (pentapeptide) pyrophosphoryl-UDP N- acetylglucosamine transferase [Candidatus Daviesbacteria bacterium GW2011_GWA2_39_33]KKR24319.1 MAG: UDP-N-acetylglucosamine-N-acetylmuramyl- (pentapeptide) pyrophosphoryl-UDP N- acetylglucosamine transferase [Candidatus Daviesbacteria b